MNTAVDVVVLTITLFVGVWVLLFGTAGALLNRGRGRTPVGGMVVGVLFGPFGLAYLLWRSRREAPPAVTKRTSPPPPPPFSPPGSHMVGPSSSMPPPATPTPTAPPAGGPPRA